MRTYLEAPDNARFGPPNTAASPNRYLAVLAPGISPSPPNAPWTQRFWACPSSTPPQPGGMPAASLVVTGSRGATHQFRLDDLWLALSDDGVGEEWLSGWATDEDADALAKLTAGKSGASVSRLTASRTRPSAMSGEDRVIDRFRSGSGGLG
ncbi:hypothetical protein ACWGHM_41900 [Streptomyces sp. NPDC054904]